MAKLLQETLNETLAALPAGGMSELAELIDPGWIEQALGATGKASIRRRKLPAEHAVWLVIGLALFRHMPLWQVVQEMALTLDGQALPAPSARAQCQRSGSPETGGRALGAPVWVAHECLGASPSGT